MTKIEMINEIKNVVMNNGGMINLGWVTFFIIDGELIRNIRTHAKKVKYETVPQIQIYLDCVRDYVAEPKATKKDIIMGLHKNDEVKCDLATAEALATEGFIDIKSYEDGVLYGNIKFVNIINDMCDEYCGCLVYSIIRYGGFNHDYLNYAMIMFDHKLISSLEYEGNRGWRAEVNWDIILIEFCKRWDNKLNEAA